MSPLAARFAGFALALLPLASASAQETYVGGSGTPSDPYRLAEFDFLGRPENLALDRETYSAAFRQDVVDALPERRDLTVSRPQLLESAQARNLSFLEAADVRVSFVHEGAGYRNMVGAFRFPTTNPPTSGSDVDHVVVFPNTSFMGSGGGLRMGDTVDLGRFEAGTSLGFFLNADGFRPNPARFTGGRWTLYTIDALNPSDLRQTVLMRDPDQARFVLAFEDIRRDVGGDKDFNDMILTVEVTPYTAVDLAGLADLELARDVDQDGVSNTLDDFPEDPTRAFSVSFPAAGQEGTLAYEDLWPFRGDFDFNDLVLGVRFTQSRNAQGKVVDLTCRYRLLARGASYHNGLVVRLPIAPEAVSSVTRRFDAFAAEPWALLSDQAQASAQVFEDAHLLLANSPGDLFANTTRNTQESVGRRVEIQFTFATPLAPELLGAAPYDTFLVRGGAEVHLPGQQPSDTIDVALLGTGDDATVPGSDQTFKTPWGQPWALYLPHAWQHPAERRSIEQGYPAFIRWARSVGAEDSDWYLRPRVSDGALWGVGQ